MKISGRPFSKSTCGADNNIEDSNYTFDFVQLNSTHTDLDCEVSFWTSLSFFLFKVVQHQQSCSCPLAAQCQISQIYPIGAAQQRSGSPSAVRQSFVGGGQPTLNLTSLNCCFSLTSVFLIAGTDQPAHVKCGVVGWNSNQSKFASPLTSAFFLASQGGLAESIAKEDLSAKLERIT